jgi:hypothetical protein
MFKLYQQILNYNFFSKSFIYDFVPSCLSEVGRRGWRGWRGEGKIMPSFYDFTVLGSFYGTQLMHE